MEYELGPEKIETIHNDAESPENLLLKEFRESATVSLANISKGNEQVKPEAVELFSKIVAREQVELANLLKVFPPLEVAFNDLEGNVAALVDGRSIEIDSDYANFLLIMLGGSKYEKVAAEFEIMSLVAHEHYHYRHLEKFPNASFRERLEYPYEARRTELGANLFAYYYLKSKLSHEENYTIRNAAEKIIGDKKQSALDIANNRAKLN